MIKINGRKLDFTGRNNISVINGEVIINGKKIEVPEKEINIFVEGDVDVLNVDTCNKIEIKQNVNTLTTVSSKVDIQGDVKGNVQSTSGDVKCNNVLADVKTVSGNVTCNSLIYAKTVSGNITRK